MGSRAAQQLKKKKQAAKRKSIAAEDAESEGLGGVPTPSVAPLTKGLESAGSQSTHGNGKAVTCATRREMATVENGTDGTCRAVDEDMLDASATSGKKPTSSDPKVPDWGDVRPPAAPHGSPHANGKHSVISFKHKKSVSFIMDGGDVDIAQAQRPDTNVEAKMATQPPYPSVQETVAQEGCAKDGAIGANESFSLRNFTFASEPGKVSFT